MIPFFSKRTHPERRVHTFDNGVKVYEDQLIPSQRARYIEVNLHEPEEEKIFLGVIQKIRPGGVFLNIGSAIGYYCFLARKHRLDLEIHAFNPHPRFSRLMEENMGLNNIFDIVTHAEAISEMDGATVLLGNRYGDKIRRLWLGRPMSRARTLTLNSFVTSLGKEIDFVQMDIQGEEFRALKGAAAVMDKIDSFLVGTHGPQLHKNCLSLLQNNGFSIRLNQETVPGQPDGMILAQRIIQG